jgi:hypothetical protein
MHVDFQNKIKDSELSNQLLIQEWNKRMNNEDLNNCNTIETIIRDRNFSEEIYRNREILLKNDVDRLVNDLHNEKEKNILLMKNYKENEMLLISRFNENELKIISDYNDKEINFINNSSELENNLKNNDIKMKILFENIKKEKLDLQKNHQSDIIQYNENIIKLSNTINELKTKLKDHKYLKQLSFSLSQV